MLKFLNFISQVCLIKEILLSDYCVRVRYDQNCGIVPSKCVEYCAGIGHYLDCLYGTREDIFYRDHGATLTRTYVRTRTSYLLKRNLKFYYDRKMIIVSVVNDKKIITPYGILKISQYCHWLTCGPKSRSFPCEKDSVLIYFTLSLVGWLVSPLQSVFKQPLNLIQFANVTPSNGRSFHASKRFSTEKVSWSLSRT